MALLTARLTLGLAAHLDEGGAVFVVPLAEVVELVEDREPLGVGRRCFVIFAEQQIDLPTIAQWLGAQVLPHVHTPS